ncbi:SPFH domain-containing protein [Hymenobacter sp. GOD-10R]|uniref:SPFH domain-containing protein n=1 Tax=Hymenobacter sp. GOD-10R TaxID=3093922 RepID=UPI002D782F80|nr:SPFH domain-containing protein [Hymenobacter sp. GOD-10R]WRQ31131.1 SPFH domain-containing protein [Hymenobacter sp. GOD-10R]
MPFSFFRSQLAEVIQWDAPQLHQLLWQFPSAHDEVKNASKLLVGPGQGALLVYEGRVADVLSTEGVYSLATDNHPFVTTLRKLRTGGESEHKLKIYFYRRAENVNQPWGTPTPVKYLDPVYGFPVELGAHGNLSFAVANARQFFTEVVGLSDLYTVPQAKALLQSRITQELATQLAAAQFSYQQLDAQLSALAARLREPLAAECSRLGLLLTDFRLTGTVFDAATQQRIGRVADATTDVQAAKVAGMTYAEREQLQALRDAARTSGGIAGAGLQLGVGVELGKHLASPLPAASTAPAPTDPVQQLQKLKLLLDEGILTPEEFEAKKKIWLDQL